MKTLLRLLYFLRPAAGEVALSILAGIATIAAGVGLLGTSAYLIAAAALHPSVAELQVAIVGVRFFGISRGVFRYVERVISHSVNLKVLSEIRVWFYQAIEPLAPARIQSIHTGDLLQRAMADIDTLENFYVRSFSPVVVALITGALASLFLGSLYPPLSAILAVGLTLNGIVLPGFVLLVSRQNSKCLVVDRARSSAGTVEFIQNLGVLQVFGAQNLALKKVLDDSDRYSNRTLANRVLEAVGDGTALFISNLTLLAVLWWTIPAVGSEVVSGVLLAVIVLVTLASFESVAPLPLAAQQFNASLEAAKRLFDLAKPEAPRMELKPGCIPSGHPEELEFRKIFFAYTPGEEDALHDIGFTLRRGQKIALVGPSGAGKTSLVNLILRFWQADKGSILLDGADIREFDEEWLRRQFGLISPTSAIFNVSLAENLRLAKRDATDNDLLEALRAVNLDEWAKGLPEHLNTLPGEQGVLLSAGERQRIAIARVLLQQPPFLLLDEPTANLDPANGDSILQRLFSLQPGAGVLLITHDLLHLCAMDEILLLEHGAIIERGSYDDLVSRKGRFARMAQMQADSLLMTP